MIAKSQTGEGHLADRGRSFDWLRQFKLRLNSDKGTIRVRAGKLLGVHCRRGIEVHPA
jgi:hypothetical protein